MRVMLLLSIFLWLGCGSKSNQLSIISQPLKRVALVIGNKDYQGFKALKNPLNDAHAMQHVLEDLNFDVTLAENVEHKEFNQLLEKFKKKIDHNTIVFFYFAGHANTLQRNSSEEYLAMIGDIQSPTLVSLYKLYEMLIEADGRYNIVVIDACRNYRDDKPMTSLGVSRGEGFREVVFDNGTVLKPTVTLDNDYASSFPPSTLISYATMHNQKAYDKGLDDPTHSPYTKALVNHLDDEEIPIELVFKRVRSDLIKEMGGKQINLEESSLEKNIWLQAKRGKVLLNAPF